MKYRPDIDGMRAVAVVPAILFHAGISGFSGGYVGVDIFFVISGFLITTILIEELRADRYSLLGFYERRARRILPAIFVMMLFCIPMAWFWMTPKEWQVFSETIVAAGLFSSNIYFWTQSDYFAPAAELTPFLHMWSLAVEEQYYLFFPIFLALTWRFARSYVYGLILLIGLISFALTEYGWRHSPVANFYLLPTRAWEIFTGSILAFHVLKNGVRPHNGLSVLGAACVVIAIIFFNSNTPFPSAYALLPVVGTALIIGFGGEKTWIGKGLSAKPIIMIGLISYSAYLWHQPLFVFARIRSLGEPSHSLMLALAALSLVIAYLSWKYVENPFRDRTRTLSKTIWQVSIIGLVFFISFGLLASLNVIKSPNVDVEDFSDWRDPNPCTVRNVTLTEERTAHLLDTCLGESDDFILLGDSHADSLARSLRAAMGEHGANLLVLSQGGCLPIPNTVRRPTKPHCEARKTAYWEIAKSTDATVIIASRWRANMFGKRYNNGEGGQEYGPDPVTYVRGDRNANVSTYASQYLTSAAENQKIILLSQIPEAGWNVPFRAAKLINFSSAQNFEDISTSYVIYDQQNAGVRDFLTALETHPNISVIRAEDVVCDTILPARCMNTIEGRSLYRDNNHPSPLHADMIAQHMIASIFQSDKE